ncbi:hypothetical protein JCM15765_14870 [Paradesulfitobacterium aromaticivorans]
MDGAVAKREKPEWYRLTVRRFSNYPLDKVRLENKLMELEVRFPSQTTHVSLSPGHSSGAVGDQTGGYAGQRWQLEQEIGFLRMKNMQIEKVFATFSKEGKELIRLKYMEGYMKDWQIAKELNMAVRSYYREKDKLVAASAVMFGYVTQEQISFEELGWRE